MIIRTEKRSKRPLRMLRKIGKGMGTAAISLLLQTCSSKPVFIEEGMAVMYGPPPDYARDVSIQGIVLSEITEKPIPGIKVSVNDQSSIVYTDEEGKFTIFVPQQDQYQLEFEDIDGPENGSFGPASKDIALEENDSTTVWQIFLKD